MSALTPARLASPRTVGAAVLVVLGGLSAAGCSWFDTVQDNLSVIGAVQEGFEEAERTQPGVRFVVEENTWFCPAKEPVLKGAPCPGGQLLEIGELIDTVGPDPHEGAWRVIYLDDTQPGGDGWVREKSLDERPKLDRYRESRQAFQEEFPAAVRIGQDLRTDDVFLHHTEKLQGLVWLDSVRREFVRDLTYATDGLSFWLPIEGDRSPGKLEAFFFLRSDRYVTRMRRHRYACTEAYCDELSFVARLIDYRYRPNDRLSPDEGFPVLEIVRFADRLDEYRVEGGPRPAPAPPGPTTEPPGAADADGGR